MKHFVILFLLALFVGCATPYQRKSLLGGYESDYLGNNTFLISVRVNAYTDEATAYKYFHRRANELVLLYNYDWYDVLDLQVGSKSQYNYSKVLERNGRVYNWSKESKRFKVEKPYVYGRIKIHKRKKKEIKYYDPKDDIVIEKIIQSLDK